MKQKKMLALTLSQLEQLYRHELHELVSIAVQSDYAEAFKANLAEYIAGHPEVDSEAGKQIRLLIEFDGQEVHELSIGEQLPISTLSMLHSFLTGHLAVITGIDPHDRMEGFVSRIDHCRARQLQLADKG